MVRRSFASTGDDLVIVLPPVPGEDGAATRNVLSLAVHAAIAAPYEDLHVSGPGARRPVGRAVVVGATGRRICVAHEDCDLGSREPLERARLRHRGGPRSCRRDGRFAFAARGKKEGEGSHRDEPRDSGNSEEHETLLKGLRVIHPSL